MILISISCHVTTHRVAFPDMDSAKREYDKLVPLVGRDRWGSNGKSEEPTHTIDAPTGPVTVVLEKVELVRLIDEDADEAIFADENAKNQEKQFAWLKRLKDADLLPTR